MPAGPASLELSPGRAAALGAIQGPTELLPVSSSAHISLVPWLAGWRWQELDPEARKSFEVALHAGTAAALLVGLRHEIAAELREFDGRRAAVVALSFVPPAIAGLTLERQIESRLGTPAATAVGLVAGALAMALADRRTAGARARRRHRGRRARARARPGGRADPGRLPQRRDADRGAVRAASPATRRTCSRARSRCP